MSLARCLKSLVLASLVSGGCAASMQTPTTRFTQPIGQPIAQPIAQPAPVETQLDRAAVRAKLAARRDVMVERFLAYRENRVYPINTVGRGYQHVWLDVKGNLCAAATLISGDWGRDATINAGSANNQLKLADVKAGVLADWMLTSGLTHHELVAIQVPGFEMEMPAPLPEQQTAEITRLHQLYVDVERQLRSLWDENLDVAVDALMRRPELARELLADRVAGPGEYAAQPIAILPSEPSEPSGDPAEAPRFATPPPSRPIASR